MQPFKFTLFGNREIHGDDQEGVLWAASWPPPTACKVTACEVGRSRAIRPARARASFYVVEAQKLRPYDQVSDADCRLEAPRALPNRGA